MNKALFYSMIVLLVWVVFSQSQIDELEKARLTLAIEQHKLEIRYLMLQLELIDESAVLTPE
ncbi:hypothetical protein [Vibrio campbellii]|uniref:hypothetical protein n=1 Tax=Vibrio campbellii TaxID=680 RepID=UPI001F1B9A2E|nr:hypothetical protein [Vibrio campbellii]MCE7729629.1 hypothetical protein [Vibrio campbellii]